MRNQIVAVLLLLLLPSVAWGADACVIDTPTGVATCDKFVARDQTGNDAANYAIVYDVDTNLTTDPTCANVCAAGEMCFVDVDESAADQWEVCVDNALRWRWPATSTTTTQFLSATGTAGVMEWEAIDLGTDTDGGYAASVSEGGPATTATDLAANGANCSAGQYPLGVDTKGAVESCTVDDDVPEAGDYTNLTGGAGIVNSPTGTIATASSETDFLAAGALTCGAGTKGKMQVHTTPIQYCDNSATPTLRYSAYGSSTGVATSATALAANGANCSAGNYPLGVDASGAVESCTADKQKFVTGSGFAVDLTTTAVYSAFWGGGIGWWTVEDYRSDVTPIALSCTELRGRVIADLTTGETVVFTMRDDAANTALSCTIDGDAASSACDGVSTKECCRDTESTPVSIAANSIVSVSAVCSGANCPTGIKSFYWSASCSES